MFIESEFGDDRLFELMVWEESDEGQAELEWLEWCADIDALRCY